MVAVAPSSVPPHILAPNLRGAAQRVIAGRGVDDQDRHFISHAREQLRVEIAASKGELVAAPHGDSHGFLTTSGASHSLSTFVVQARAAGRASSVAEEMQLTRSSLESAVRDLELLEGGDPEAAERVKDLFTETGDRSLGSR